MGLASTVRFILGHPLNRADRSGALGRYVRWQLASRLMPDLVSFPFVEGTRLFARRGMTGATGNWYCGLHEVHEMAFVLHMLRPEDLFVDVGANLGSYTVIAAGAAGAQGLALEPVPSSFESLERNIALNGLGGRVVAMRIGASDAPGTVRFTSGLDTMNHVLGPGEEAPSIEVEMSTVDVLLAGRVPAVMKIDVEGHEHAVLRGAARTLESAMLLAVVMETNGSGNRYGLDDAALFETMRAHGFMPFGYDPFARRLVDAAGGNTVFVRDRGEVERRVGEARRFRLVNGSI
jgi:FkbM family methyltransferase